MFHKTFSVLKMEDCNPRLISAENTLLLALLMHKMNSTIFILFLLKINMENTLPKNQIIFVVFPCPFLDSWKSLNFTNWQRWHFSRSLTPLWKALRSLFLVKVWKSDPLVWKILQFINKPLHAVEKGSSKIERNVMVFMFCTF